MNEQKEEATKKLTPEQELKNALETLQMTENQLVGLLIKSSNRKVELQKQQRAQFKSNKDAMKEEVEYLELLARRQGARSAVYGREQEDTELVQNAIKQTFDIMPQPEMTEVEITFIEDLKKRIYPGFNIPLDPPEIEMPDQDQGEVEDNPTEEPVKEQTDGENDKTD